MFTWMRTHQQKLMLLITLLTILAFVAFYDRWGLNFHHQPPIAKIYGKSLSLETAQQEARFFELALLLGLQEYVQILGETPSPSQQPSLIFVINQLVLKQEAKNLQLMPQAHEIKDAITHLKPFQTNGHFDPQKYLHWIQKTLILRGWTERDLEALVQQSLSLEKIRTLLASPLTAAPAEIRFAQRAFQPVSGQAIFFPMQNWLPQIIVTDADIQTYYTKHSNELIQPALRTIRFVSFALPDSQKSLPDTEKISTLQQQADAASHFLEQATQAGFEATANTQHLPIHTTRPFDAQGTPQVPAVSTPSTAASPSTSTTTDTTSPSTLLTQAAFQLTDMHPLSDVIQDHDTFYIAELISQTPEHPLTLEEARENVKMAVQKVKAQATLQQEATQQIHQIRKQLKTGQTLTNALTQASQTLKPKTLHLQGFSNLTPVDSTLNSDQQMIAINTLLLNPGEITGFIPTTTGGFAVGLETRMPLNETLLTQEKNQTPDFILNRKKNILFFSWLEDARQKAHVQWVKAP